MYKEDAGYANSRLAGTRVMLGTHLVYIEDVKRNMNVVYTKLGEEGEHECHLTDLSLASPEIGYCKVKMEGRSSYVYVSRLPKRRDWRQGIRRPNLGVLGANVSIDRVKWTSIEDAINNIYPTFEEARKLLWEDGINSVAWCKDFLISLGGDIHYRGKRVGDFKNNKFIPHRQYQYLKEAFKESLG